MGDCLVRTQPGFSRFKAFVFDGAKDQLVQVSLSWYLVGTTKSPFSQDGFGDFVLPYQNQIGQGLMLEGNIYVFVMVTDCGWQISTLIN